MKTIIILSVSSDIGLYLAKKYLERGDRVIGTYRSDDNLGEIKDNPNCTLFYCNINGRRSAELFVEQLKAAAVVWDTLISCVGQLTPVRPFFECDFDEWEESVDINSIDQLRMIHKLYPSRNPKGANVVLFAGGAMNNAVVNMSAYTISKIMLAKMCEFLDSENKDLNVFIVGPGWTKTKIHQQILDDPASVKAKVEETQNALKDKEGTSLEDIFNCIDLFCAKGKPVAGGRNFSVVYDPWRGQTLDNLLEELSKDVNMYKLRRHKNEFMQKDK
jgi:NAD(P)-dependent dehydrogenase (short-subunit alcohol dehydrogenase family)